MSDPNRLNLDKTDVNERARVFSTDRSELAKASIVTAGKLSAELSSDSSSLRENSDIIDLAWRNIAVLDDRINTSTDIYGVSDEQRKKVDSIKAKSEALLIACGKKVESHEGLHELQSSIMSRELPDDSAGMISVLLKEATVVFADITIDSGVQIEDHLQSYFAKNTAAIEDRLERTS